MAQVIKIKRGTTAEIENALSNIEENEIIFNTSTNQLGVMRPGSILRYMAAAVHTHSAANINTGTLPVARGGTGRTSHTVNQVIIGGTTTTGAQQSVAGGTSGYVLTSNGPTAAPSWKAPAGGGGSLSELAFSGSGYAAYDGSIPINVQAGDGIDIVDTSSGSVKIQAEGPIYGYSTTSVGTTAKVVSATSSSNPFTGYKKNQLYIIEFTTGNTATAPTININSAGAKTVRHLTTGGATTTNPGSHIFFSRNRGIGTFVYDGTYMILLSYVSRYHNALETKMLGYSKGSSGAAVTTSDTVSSAIGKLEYRLDNMGSGGGGGLTRGFTVFSMSSPGPKQFNAPAGIKFLTLTKITPGGAETIFVEMSILEGAMTYDFSNFWSGLYLNIVDFVGHWVFEVNDTNILGFQLQIAWYS